MLPWLGILLVCVSLSAVIVGLRVYQSRFNPHPEFVRKLLHIMMGLVALTFPWLFTTVWPVWVLAGLAAGGLLLLRFQKALSSDFGEVVHGVDRHSLGEFYFPFSIALVFHLAQGDSILFLIPVSILTLADATAALIGVRYGRAIYHTTNGVKSVEGSIVFFVVTFLCVHIPLLLLTDVDRANCLLIGLIMGVLVMLFEAIAWRGLDNLFVPIGSFFLLEIYWTMATNSLLWRFIVILILLLLLISFRRLSTLNDSATIGAVLVGYVSWALCGMNWLLPPLIVFVTYAILAAGTEQSGTSVHSLKTVFGVSVTGLFWLFVNRIWQQELLLFPYTLAFAANLAMIGIAREGYRRSQWSGAALIARGTVEGWVLLFLPYLVVNNFSNQAWLSMSFALLVVFLAAALFYHWQPNIRDCANDLMRWIRQVSVASAASLSGLLLVVFNIEHGYLS